jgi:hypothetical protein
MKKISMWVMAAALAFTANHVKAQWLLTGNTTGQLHTYTL